MKENVNIVIVGHVDHGKSTLIGRLLYDTNSLPNGLMEEIEKTSIEMGIEAEFAYILDSLEEERAQNVTIDTTQIFFKSKDREYTIIDAPGHKEFLKNMITGASLADIAVLIIDAKEGIKEQTKRHLTILEILGIKQVIILINKMDLVDFEFKIFERIKSEIINFLSRINLAPLFVIPISAKLGDNVFSKSKNMEWYNQDTFLEALDSVISKNKFGDKLRMPVQDVYKIDNERIIVGKIESGTIKSGQEIIFYPSEKKSRVKEVKEFLQKREEAYAGESIGITIEDPLFIERGEVIFSINEKPVISDRISAFVFWMDKQPLAQNEKVKLRCATQEVNACVVEIDKILDSSTLEEVNRAEVNQTEICYLTIKTERPIVIDNPNEIPELGRFVLEKEDIIGAGIIK